jgi:hypothetical protein
LYYQVLAHTHREKSAPPTADQSGEEAETEEDVALGEPLLYEKN